MYNILITAIGKRVQLIKHLKTRFNVIGTDLNKINPASYFVNKFYQVPRYYECNYVETLIAICKKENIKLLIPLYEKEFDVLLDNRDLFVRNDIKLLLSDKQVINICNDKFKTYRFFSDNNILTPLTYSKNEILNKSNLTFPMIVKPLDGMGSEEVYKVNSGKELNFFIDYVDNSIIQVFKNGVEYTIDILCEFNGDIISIVPRQRLEIRAGEVSKSKTVKNDNIIYKTKELIDKLNSIGKAIGPITVQCILSDNNIYFIEINPRFGGGVPLTFEAGVDYSYYLNNMLDNKKCDSIIGDFKEITMLRYDDAVFFRS